MISFGRRSSSVQRSFVDIPLIELRQRGRGSVPCDRRHLVLLALVLIENISMNGGNLPALIAPWILYNRCLSSNRTL